MDLKALRSIEDLIVDTESKITRIVEQHTQNPAAIKELVSLLKKSIYSPVTLPYSYTENVQNRINIYKQIISIPLDDMPLYLNENSVSAEIARIRLSYSF